MKNHMKTFDLWHLYKILIGAKSLHLRFVKIDRFIRIYDVTRYLTFLGAKKHDAIYSRIRHLISLKSSIAYVFSHH